MSFQVQSVQKYLRECVVPPGKVALCMCVLPDLLPRSFILPLSLQLFKTNKKKENTKLPLNSCDFSALELLCVSQICAGAYTALFSLHLHIYKSWATLQNIPDSSQEEIGGMVERSCFFFFFFLSFPSRSGPCFPRLIRGNNVPISGSRSHFLKI